MPAAIRRSNAASGIPEAPPAIQALLDALSLSPATTAIPTATAAASAAEPMLKSLGKPISELLDLILNPTTKGTGLPNRLRLTNWNAREGNVQFHGAGPTRMGVERFEATPRQLDQLIKGGALDVEQPPAGMVETMRRRISKALDK